MSFQTNNTDHLVRSQLWSSQIKSILEDKLYGTQFVRMLTDFPDGDVLNIPSIGQAEVLDYAEGNAIRYTAMDTGNFQFQLTDYKSSATFISNKAKQDWFYASQLISQFVPRMIRAMDKAVERSVLHLPVTSQVASDPNTINGGRHRFVASGTNQVITPADFARASYALDMANVPEEGRVAIVHPSVAHTISTLSGFTDVTYNPKMEGIITSGIASNMRFIRNIYGFDVYVSQNLRQGISETISTVSVTNGVGNLFFSAAGGDVSPWVGLIRQSPVVESEYNKDLQQDEYVMTMRYGFGFYRPENMVVVLSDTSRVYS